jgi:aminoglycoside phosphotransferase (APT) family kinase protein
MSAVPVATDSFAPQLEASMCRALPGTTGIAKLRRLSGGASQETWSFEAVSTTGPRKLILRRAPGGERQSETAAGLETEAALIDLAGKAGVPEPAVVYVMRPGDGVGRGFVVDFVEGETLGRKIVRDDTFAEARKTLAFQCGQTLARIHQLPLDRLPKLRTAQAKDRFEELHQRYRLSERPRPVFALAFEWLRERLPQDPPPPQLVHGDFRNGNLIVGTDGLRAVLDWELAHLGDPVEDLGWICIAPWRFGGEGPAGGFGSYQQLLDGYAAGGGGEVMLEQLKWWEVLGSLSWGVSCASMHLIFRSGVERTSERAMIARRASENEIDLLNLLVPRGN